MNPLEGYAVNFTIDTVYANASQITANISGVVNNVPLQVTLTNNSGLYTNGFNLVGNPYPSPIDWKAATGWTKNNIDEAIYFFKAGKTNQYTGVYSSYVDEVSTGSENKIIASMQGFFVHVTLPGSAILGTTNAVRITNLNPSFKAAIIDDRTILRFAASFETINAIEDVAVIYFDDEANPGFDGDKDALKMHNTDLLVPNIYTLSTDNKQLSINGMSTQTDSITRIPLGIKTLSDGRININAKKIDQLSSGLNIYLVDAEKGVLQNLKQQPNYRIYLKAGEYNTRFKLIFSLAVIADPATFTEKMFSIIRSSDLLLVKMNLPFNASGTLMVTNMLGQQLLQQSVFENETVEIQPKISSGIFVVTVISGKRKLSEKILLRKDYE